MLIQGRKPTLVRSSSDFSNSALSRSRSCASFMARSIGQPCCEARCQASSVERLNDGVVWPSRLHVRHWNHSKSSASAWERTEHSCSKLFAILQAKRIVAKVGSAFIIPRVHICRNLALVSGRRGEKLNRKRTILVLGIVSLALDWIWWDCSRCRAGVHSRSNSLFIPLRCTGK
jgi:hypothetical protein